ncbi:hypothetical protein F5X68DRAFT_189569 [Plectosphaerella plurivora]|uniref:NAD(P)-binding protein n=1 Tax=Plectosphaerella plurivora TaxID=936078 RepID=A0A9P8VFD8_9PEZI|nr:hypothetical protein F5X68DRAFT_189569 [Plectosphaerella plurivora]
MTGQIVLVTGANQGLGHAIVEVAAKTYPGNTYIVASRDKVKGETAVSKLRELGVSDDTVIDLVKLDVDSNDEVVAVAKYVEERYGRLDVLINNAGYLRMPAESDLGAVRAQWNALLNTHITSVAVVTYAFKHLLHKSGSPKVINITSGLASMTNTLARPSPFPAPGYGASKAGLNGLTAHLQTGENKRIASGASAASAPLIRFYAVAPGVLKTAFTGFQVGKPPQLGAQVVMQLLGDEEGTYPGGTQWQFENGEMMQVPW